MKVKLWPDKDLAVKHVKADRVPLLVIRPAQGLQRRIGVLWIHGGGYVTGMKEVVYMSRAMDLVRKFGVSVFSPGYRLAWLRPYPAAVQDCFAALRYMDEHKEDLGLSSIMVGGESAGGGLAVAVCMMARDKGISVSFQMPLYPMISNLDTVSSRDNHGKVWNTRRNHFGWKLYLRGDAKKAVSCYAAPAGADDFHNLPPCYTFVGDGEPFYAETLQYVSDLRAAGVSAEVDVYHTDMHAFDMLRPDDELSRQAINRFEEVFRKKCLDRRDAAEDVQ